MPGVAPLRQFVFILGFGSWDVLVFLFLCHGGSIASIWIFTAQTFYCFGCQFLFPPVCFPISPFLGFSFTQCPSCVTYTTLIIFPPFHPISFPCFSLSRLSGFPWDCTFPSFETGGGIRLRGIHQAHIHTHMHTTPTAAIAQHHAVAVAEAALRRPAPQSRLKGITPHASLLQLRAGH